MPVYSISVADNLQIPFDYSCDYTKKKKNAQQTPSNCMARSKKSTKHIIARQMNC